MAVMTIIIIIILIIIIHNNNSMARKLPIKKCMGKIAVQLKLHGEIEIARN